MGQSDELLLLSLAANELRTLLALRHLADQHGHVLVTMEELGILTKYSRETLRVAIRGLEEAKLLATNRTKRNLGRLYKNEYQLLQINLASEESELQKNLASTADYVSNSKQGKSLVSKTSSYLEGVALMQKFREVKVVNKWTDDDDNIGGYGLLEGEVPAAHKPLAVSKRSPRTRTDRPKADWTAADVASEFSSRLYQKITGVPALVNTDKLRAIISKYRKDYGTTALVELQVMDMFFGDDRNITAVRKEPHNAWRWYLRNLTTKSQEAKDLLENKTAPVVKSDEYLYATDGTEFDNTMSGRASLAKYEEKLGSK